MRTIGYMEGTNPEVLTTLLINGYETLPFSNSWDNHGKFIAQITRHDNLALMIGWLHKFIPITKELGFGDVLAPLRIYEIPVVFIVPESMQTKAHELLADKAVTYKLADPALVTGVVFDLLEPEKSKDAGKA
jgi:hypothetical protein